MNYGKMFKECAWTYSNNPDIAAACFVDGARTFICLNNLDDYEQSILRQGKWRKGP